MSRIIRIIRNHPKKTIVFVALSLFGSKLASGKLQENALMRAYCEEAVKYGNESYASQESERHVTVLLNPAANNGKGKRNFDKYCAPLLHLAGLKVAVVQTEHEGQARELMQIMESTSAVIIAGGDGTVSETVTGLMRRDDALSAAKRFPLGILPLGQMNIAWSAVWGVSSQPDVKQLAESTMAIIRSITRPLDVMEIQQLEGSEGSSKSVFAISQLEWGACRDARERKDVYWYWAILKKYMTYVFSSYKDLSWDCQCKVQYSCPCSGCSSCRAHEIREAELRKAQQAKQRRWWHSYVAKGSSLNNEDNEVVDYSQIINEDCQKTVQLQLESVSDVQLRTCNTAATSQLPGYTLSLRIGKHDIGVFEFIKEGWHREFSGECNYESELLVGQVTIVPDEKAQRDRKGKEREFNIDNETYEVRPIRILPRPRAVTIFAPPVVQSAAT